MSIASAVNEVSEYATSRHPGDQVLSLMALVQDEGAPLRERNRAVWALGQLGDTRALPLLERLYIGRHVHEPGKLSQYELKKAVKLCSGGLNITAWIWRPRTAKLR